MISNEASIDKKLLRRQIFLYVDDLLKPYHQKGLCYGVY